MAAPAPPGEFDENSAVNQAQNPQQQEPTILDNEEDEEYNSEEDPDFDADNPAAAAADGSGDSEAESEREDAEAVGADGDAAARPRKRRKLIEEIEDEPDSGADEDFAMGELESGDEATIREGKERMKKKDKKKKKGKKGGKGEDDEEGEDFELDDDEAGGEGGFVRTRGMKMRMQEERRPLANAAQSTIDVNALWEEMNRPASERKPEQKQDGHAEDKENGMDTDENTAAPRPGEETITIKRVYNFAGERITEEKVVSKDSAEAKLYLASVEKSAANTKPDDDSEAPQQQIRRPLRRISRFDPNPPDAIKKSWEKKMASPTGTAAGGGAQKGPKLNTVMKSRLDWAAYVDREGIKDELDVHSRAKDSYLNRTDFLNRTDARQEEERRNIRLRKMG